ncbi:hypothetical protein XENOCAPTIV_023621, partial [Xenoophorus captivus]
RLHFYHFSFIIHCVHSVIFVTFVRSEYSRTHICRWIKVKGVRASRARWLPFLFAVSGGIAHKELLLHWPGSPCSSSMNDSENMPREDCLMFRSSSLLKETIEWWRKTSLKHKIVSM